MAVQTFNLTPGRINKFKGEILKHAVPDECLVRAGRQVKFPKNSSDTYVARRFLPYGATATSASSQNAFFQNGPGDRGNLVVQANQMTEGVTPQADSIIPVDISVQMAQYGCLYSVTDKTAELYEDDIPAQMIKQVGERITFVGEMIVYGALRACTNVYFGGAGTSISTVTGPLTMGLLRRVTRGLQANHARPVNSVLSASQNFGTNPVPAGYTIYCHTDMEPDLRDLPNFTPAEQYASGKPMPGEIGMCERMRFITSPDLPPIQDGGAAVGSAPGLNSTSGSNIDIYPMIVLGQDAFSQISVRGIDSLDPTYLQPGEKTKADPLGQRGYIGASFWKAVMIENPGWMAIANVGTKILL